MAENQNLLDMELLCPKCQKECEILNIHTDNGKIELKCKNCGIFDELIIDYINKLNKLCSHINCSDCRREIAINNAHYCYQCHADICESCKNREKHLEHNCIAFCEKKYHCPKHYDEIFMYYCSDCQENICKDELESLHKDHDINEISKMEEIFEKYKKIIKSTNGKIMKLIAFNNLILNTGERYNNNYFHLKSIINLGKSLEEGNKRNSKDIKLFLKELSLDIQKSEEAIKVLLDDKDIQLYRNNKYIHLNARELGDKYFNYISQIRFNQLKEIDISENNITDISGFKKMSLPFIEFLNLGHNKIKIIEPIAKLKSKNLKYIFLQANEIQDIETLKDSEFPSLLMLRLEEEDDENINEERKKKRENSLKELNDKYSKKVISKPMKKQIQEFKQKYDFEISEEIDDIDLFDRNGGLEMLEKLFLIITYKTKNKINKLILRNNLLKEAGLLKRINFKYLHTLDLSVNELTSIKFLLDMKAENLKYLYLDNNKLNDINPLLNNNFPNLEVVSLNKNNFIYEDLKKSLGYEELKAKKAKNEKTLGIQLDEKEGFDKSGQNNNEEDHNSLQVENN